jgi:hypothetical protein
MDGHRSTIQISGWCQGVLNAFRCRARISDDCAGNNENRLAADAGPRRMAGVCARTSSHLQRNGSASRKELCVELGVNSGAGGSWTAYTGSRSFQARVSRSL